MERGNLRRRVFLFLCQHQKIGRLCVIFFKNEIIFKRFRLIKAFVKCLGIVEIRFFRILYQFVASLGNVVRQSVKLQLPLQFLCEIVCL